MDNQLLEVMVVAGCSIALVVVVEGLFIPELVVDDVPGVMGIVDDAADMLGLVEDMLVYGGVKEMEDEPVEASNVDVVDDDVPVDDNDLTVVEEVGTIELETC